MFRAIHLELPIPHYIIFIRSIIGPHFVPFARRLYLVWRCATYFLSRCRIELACIECLCTRQTTGSPRQGSRTGTVLVAKGCPAMPVCVRVPRSAEPTAHHREDTFVERESVVASFPLFAPVPSLFTSCPSALTSFDGPGTATP